MDPINKERRTKSIQKAIVWTLLTTILLIICMNGCYQQKQQNLSAGYEKVLIQKDSIIKERDTVIGELTVAKEVIQDSRLKQELAIKDAAFLLMNQIDTLLEQAIVLNNEYLIAVPNKDRGYAGLKSEADKKIAAYLTALEDFKNFGNTSENFAMLYQSFATTYTKFNPILKETRTCCETPPADLDCSNCPCDTVKCPCICPDQWKKILEDVLTHMDKKKIEIEVQRGVNENKKRVKIYGDLLEKIEDEINQALR